MARRRTQPKVTNPVQDRLLRQNFLQVVNRTCPEAFSTLRNEDIELIGVHLQLWDPTILSQDFSDVSPHILAPFVASAVSLWAVKYGVEATWIEAEMKYVVDLWFRHPELRTDRMDALPLCVTTQNDLSEPALELSIPIPHAIGFERHNFSWPAIEKHLREQAAHSIEEGLRQLKAEAFRYGFLREAKPLNYDSHIFRALALYLFGEMSAQEIGAVTGLAGDRTTVWRWIKEASTAVDLADAVQRRQAYHTATVHRADTR